MNKLSRKQSIALIITLPIILVIGLVVHDMRLFGSMRITTNFLQASAHTSILTPQARIENGKVIGEPLHFTLRTPTYFDKASFKFSLSDVHTPVSLGYEQEGGITFVPISAPLLSNLNWNFGCGDDYCVYYQPSISDITQVPITKTATYQLDKFKPFVKSNWNLAKTYSLPLIGSHNFVFEVNGDELDARFDIPQGFISADVVYNNQVITTYETNPVSIQLGGVTSGYFEVRVRTQSDAQIQSLTTPHRFVIKDQVMLAQGSQTLTTSSAMAKFITYDKSGIGEVVCDAVKQNISQTHQMKYCEIKNSFTTKQGNLTIALDGVVALTPSLFFNPFLPSLTTTNEVPENVDVIYTSFRDGEAQIKLDHTTKHNFLISAPYLETAQPFTINDMSVHLTKSRYYILDYLKLWTNHITRFFK